MIHLVVGHRGVGKTSFLSRVAQYYKDSSLPCVCVSLEDEIRSAQGRSLAEIIRDEGEEKLNRLEQEALDQIVQKHEGQTGALFIELSPDFRGDLPAYAKVIWLRRPTDRVGRIFLDRPRLDSNMNPIDEYRSRYMSQVARFRKWNTRQIAIEEAWVKPSRHEKALIGLLPGNLEATITVLPDHFQNEVRLEDFISDKLQMGIRYFELRDDLLSPEEMDRFYREVPRNKILFGFRTQSSVKGAKDAWWFNCDFDWSLELGDCPWGVPKILSLHYRDRHEGVREAIERLMECDAEHYKLAIPIDNLVELWAGHAWASEDPEKRSFLPMSQDGRWWWYRAWRGASQKINFVCEAEGSSFDQPNLFQWLRVQEFAQSDEFAGVLGKPVDCSHTSAIHHDFLSKKGMPFFSIQLSEDDVTELGLGILQRLGLRAFSVEPPFKSLIAGMCESLTSEAQSLKSVNTVVWDRVHRQWIGSNTEVKAIESFLSGMSLPAKLFVWGGGGVRSTLMRLLPKALFFRARSGDELFGNKVSKGPDLLIWAVGRHRQPDCVWPDRAWKPKMVLDLNFTEDSPGREYAQMVGAAYISGQEIFKEQAQGQEAFWERYLSSENSAEMTVDRP